MKKRSQGFKARNFKSPRKTEKRKAIKHAMLAAKSSKKKGKK